MTKKSIKSRKGEGTKKPQFSGWNSNRDKYLKPENIERLSDSQLKITWPPMPDYDIDEDEVIQFWIPPEVLVKSTKPVYAGSFTIKADSYIQRIDKVLLALEEEHSSLGEDTAVPSFIFTFFACEILAKTIVSYCKYNGTDRKSLSGKWSTKDINSAIAKLDIKFSSEFVAKLFSEEKKLASEASARSLRDSVAHKMKSVPRSAIKSRYGELMTLMDTFILEVSRWRDKVNE